MRLDSFDTSVLRESGKHPQINHVLKLQCGLEGSEQAAKKLRARGVSYRRIAELLSVRYDIVAQWLAGVSRTNEHPSEPERPIHRVQAPQAEHRPTVSPFNDSCLSGLEHRLSAAFSMLQRLSDEARQREARLLTTLAEERQSARMQIERLEAEVAALRVALAALSMTDKVAASVTEDTTSAPSGGLWRWGTKK